MEIVAQTKSNISPKPETCDKKKRKKRSRSENNEIVSKCSEAVNEVIEEVFLKSFSMSGQFFTDTLDKVPF